MHNAPGEQVDHAPGRAVRDRRPTVRPARRVRREPAHRGRKPFAGRPTHAPGEVDRAGCPLWGRCRPPHGAGAGGRGVGGRARDRGRVGPRGATCGPSGRPGAPGRLARRGVRRRTSHTRPKRRPRCRASPNTYPSRRPSPDTGRGTTSRRAAHPGRPWSAASRSGHVTRSRIGVSRRGVRRSAVRSSSASGARPATGAAPDPRTPAPRPTPTYRPRPPPRLTPRRRTAQS